MNCSKLIGVCRGVAPSTELKGIGDEPLAPLSDGASMIMHRGLSTSLEGTKVDQHASFPKGMPRAFRIDEHVR